MNSAAMPKQPVDDVQLDAMHQRIFFLLEGAKQQAGQAFPPAFMELVSAIEQDFRREEQLMETFQCADTHTHREQHARMQAGLHHAESALMQGNEEPARQAIDALAEWLPFHISTQDRHLVSALRSALS